MDLSWIDWLIILVPLGAVFWIGYQAQRCVKGVADFLSAGRAAGRYLLSVADGAAGMGLISLVATFEMTYKSGSAISFWWALLIPVGLAMNLTGFVIYRYRETRAMTLAQFFEMRYSKAFRVFAGFLAFLAGVLNYAIFPAVSARCIQYFLRLPETVSRVQ